MANINDLRSALELLQTIDEQYVETDVEVDPNAELSGDILAQPEFRDGTYCTDFLDKFLKNYK